MTYEISMVVASNTFLTTPLPDNWHTWEDKEQDSFVTDNAWQPFENADAKSIWEHIDNLAFTLRLAVKKEQS